MNLTTIFRANRLGLVLGCLLVILAYGQRTACAQAFSMNMDMGEMSVPISAGSVKAYGKILGLDATQQDALKDLHEGYKEQHQALSKEMQEAVQATQDKFNETKDPSVWGTDFPKAMRTIGLKMETLEKEFYQDLRSTLTEAQSGKFIGVERHRRRDKHMRFGMVGGESADLFKAAERAGVEPMAGPAAELFNGYEADVDKILLARDELGKEALKEPEPGASAMDAKAIQKAMDMMKTVRAQGLQLRGVHKDHARRIAGALPEGMGAKFEHEYSKLAFPKIFRDSHPMKLLDSAAKLEDLEASQRESLALVREQYERELAAVNERWAQAVQDRDDKLGDDPMAMAAMFMPNANEQGPLADAKKARRELDERVGDRVLAALNAAQKDKLPKAPKKHVTQTGDGPFEMEWSGDFEAGDGEVNVIIAPGGG
jgi:hypothetical protein